MCLEVLGDVVAPCEPLLALRTFKALITCVRACMPLQLVAAGEPLSTESPIAHERPLPSMQADMGSQEGRLAKRSPTFRNVTHVSFSSRGAPPLFTIFAVWAGTGHSSPLLSRLELSG